MKSSSRVLAVSGLALGVVVILALVLAVVLSGLAQPDLLAENTPEGVVQRFFIAIDEGDYLKAYSYISPPRVDENFYEMWKGPFSTSGERPAFRVSLGQSTRQTLTASVEVIVETFRPGSPFGSNINTNRLMFMLKLENGNWRITSPIDVWWLLY
jgi:hypothetical protein